MQNLGSILSKYLFPILLILAGLLFVAVSGEQNTLFLIGGLGILIVGVLSILYIKGIISRKVQIGITVVIALGAVYFAYMDYAVISERLAYEKKKERVNMHVIQRMKDIRKAQLAYKKENNKYAASFDSLLYFLKEGELSLVKRLGSLPDTVPTDEMARELGLIQKMPEGMTDEEVLASGIIVRDTVKVNVLSYVFNEDDRKDRKTPFYVDSLPYVPFADHKFEMRADMIDLGGVQQPVFLVKDPKPFEKPGFSMGSLTEASTSGNWKE
jgi:hypothetical protein